MSAAHEKAWEEENGTMVGLIADIGGTNARFALADETGGIRDCVKLATPAFPSLAQAVEAALARLRPSGSPVVAAVIAIAAPVVGRTARMTNGSWEVDGQALADRFGWRICKVINDFAAIGHAIPQLAADGLLTPLDSPDAPWRHERTRLVVGPGTGLGVAAVRETGEEQDRVLVQATEAGHVGFAPESAQEWALAQDLAARFGRVSVERILSGPGLLTLYRWLGGRRAQTPEAVAKSARGGDEAARRAALWFLDILARFAGDMALAHGAWGGVLLTGGVWQGLLPLVDPERFRRLFAAKGRYRPLLARTMLARIDHADPGLVGSARLLAELLQEYR